MAWYFAVNNFGENRILHTTIVQPLIVATITLLFLDPEEHTYSQYNLPGNNTMAMAKMLEGGMGVGKGAIMQLGMGVAGFTTVMKAINTVETGEMGVITRFKKVIFNKQGQPKVVGPGKHLTFPDV
jgi:hypothetical protein